MKSPQVTLLAIHATVPGRKLPTWKATFDSHRTLEDVVRCWAKLHLGIEVNAEVPAEVVALSGSSSDNLDLSLTVAGLRRILRIQEGAFCLKILWPLKTEQSISSKTTRTASSALGKLRRLHPSSRYCNVDRRVMMWSSSSTHLGKIAAGAYKDTRGQYPEAELASSMRAQFSSGGSSSSTSRADTHGDHLQLESRTLVVFHDDDDKQELFRVYLRGPKNLVSNWEATCDRYEVLRAEKLPDKQAAHVPHPVFIPSRGRPEKAHLNWQASHVFGPPKEDSPPGLRPVVCSVIEPAEEAEYRKVWPESLMMILPDSNRGPGYSRWIVQKVCTKAFSESKGSIVTTYAIRRLGRIWIVDDTLTMFYKLEFIEDERDLDNLARPRRLKRRVVGDGPMFLEAMLAVQQHPLLPRVAIAGFLRDDGTAVCKRNDWKVDEMALYKVVLLNLPELWRLGAEYMPALQMYEDICLNHEVLSKSGRTLKCQCYGFRAVHTKQGGCLEQRNIRGRDSNQTQLQHLVRPEAFKSLNEVRQQAVLQLLQWVQEKEKLFKCKVAEKECQAAGDFKGRKRCRDNVLEPQQHPADVEVLDISSCSDGERHTAIHLGDSD